MKSLLGWCCFFCCFLNGTLFAERLRFLRYPALSPDATQISFSYGGDLFIASLQGGTARKITTHPAYEGVSLWSPDGHFLLFESDRTGNIDIFRMDLQTGETVALTFFENDEKLCDFSSQGQHIILSAVYDSFYPHRPLLYQIPITGGTPERLLEDFSAFGSVVPKEKGKGNKIFYTRGQIDWWRQGYRGSANEEIYSYDFSTKRYEKLTSHPGQDRFPMPLTEDHFFYLSDENVDGVGKGLFHLVEWKLSQKEPLSFHSNESVQFPRINVARTHIIYCCGWDIYCYSILQQKTTLIEISPFFGETEGLSVVEESFQGNIEDFTVTEAGEHFLVSARGDLFRFYRPKQGKIWPPQPLAEHIAREENPVFTQEGREAFFISERSGIKQMYQAISEEPYLPLSMAKKVKIQSVSPLLENAFNLSLSPDEKKLAFVRSSGELGVRYLSTGEERILAQCSTPPENYCWSPDSQWIAYEAIDENFNHEVFLVSLLLREIVNLSEHPDYDGRPSWSPDGTRIVFVSRRQGESEEIFLSVLDKKFYESSEEEEIRQEIRKKYQLKKQKPSPITPQKKPKSKKKKQEFWTDPKMEPSEFLWNFSRKHRKPSPETSSEENAMDWRWVNVDIENIASRLRRLTYSLEEENNPIWDSYALGIFFCADPTPIRTAPTGKSWDLFYLALPSLQMKRVTLDEMAPEKMKVVGSSLYFLSKGNLYELLMGVGNQGILQWSHPQKIPFQGVLRYVPAQRRQAFLAEIWKEIQENFYDLCFNGKSWASVGWKYAYAVQFVHHRRDFMDLVSQMLGELNTSHLSYQFSTKNLVRTGILGIQYEKVSEGLQIMEVTSGGPCDQTENQIVLGEVLTAVNGHSLLEYNLHQLLENTIDREVQLTLKNEDQIREITVHPISWEAFKKLSYQDYCTRSREYVEQYSRRKLGYIHLAQMTPGSFADFEQELYKQSLSGKKGLILDIRNNGGGWYADYFFMALQFSEKI
ncbi:MAG: S41 family peptidase, partial [Planctomycetota bacterium]